MAVAAAVPVVEVEARVVPVAALAEVSAVVPIWAVRATPCIIVRRCITTIITWVAGVIDRLPAVAVAAVSVRWSLRWPV